MTNPFNINLNNVDILDQDYNSVFPDAQIIRVVPNERAMLFRHPLETGSKITDHRITEPVEIEIPIFVQSDFYGIVYQSIKQMFEQGTLLLIQTRLTVYENMCIAALPHEEDSDKFDSVVIHLRFQEAQFATPVSNYAPADATQSDTVQQGQQQPSAVTSTPGGVTDVQTNVNGKPQTIPGASTMGGMADGGASGSW